MGLEPTRSCDHRHLKPARLPIPPLLHFLVVLAVTGYKFGYKAVDELVNAIRNVNVISAEKIKAVYESNYNESVNYEKLVKIYTNVAAKNNCN